MTAQELYYDFHLLLNKNNEDKEINIEAPNFVKLYNREAERWLADYIENNNKSDKIFELDFFLIPDVELERIDSRIQQDIYRMPKDCFSIIEGDFRSEVESEGCKKTIFNEVAKTQEVNSLLSNKFTAPSFAWERGLAKVTKEGITVYKNNFEIDKTLISYYIRPKKIDLKGYVDSDNNLSEDKDPNYSDYIAQQILDRVVTEVHRQFENSAGFQLSKERQRSF